MIDKDPAGMFPSIVDFEEWGYCPNPNVDGETYLATFLATWLGDRALNDSSTSVRLETFWGAIEMARGRKYSLAVPDLAWPYNWLGEFHVIKG